jgi:hypothetical protein
MILKAYLISPAYCDLIAKTPKIHKFGLEEIGSPRTNNPAEYRGVSVSARSICSRVARDL